MNFSDLSDEAKSDLLSKIEPPASGATFEGLDVACLYSMAVSQKRLADSVKRMEERIDICVSAISRRLD